MTRGWMVLGGLVLVASAVPLAQVARDRSGAPRATMVLSNRELAVRWSREENSGVTLSWTWSTAPFIDSLTRDQLDSVGVRCPGTGYECDAPTGTRGWIVVGLDTVPWQRSIDAQRRALASIGIPAPGDSATKLRRDNVLANLKQLLRYTSRLRLVGVGRDPEALAAAWNDGKHLILPARLWVHRQTYPRQDRPGEIPRFSVNATPLPDELYVPVQWAGLVTDSTGAREQLYEVTVAVGKGWLPRVLEVRKVMAPEGSAETP